MSANKIDAEAILRDCNILDIVSDRVPLTKKGSEYYGVCPFHEDDSASLQVNDRKQIYKCFACGSGGDAIAFVMDYEKCSFPAACADISGDKKIHGNTPIEKKAATPKKTQIEWKHLLPPEPPKDINHWVHGKPAKVWSYRTKEGKLIGYVCRFNMSDGSKQILPYTYATDGKKAEWRWLGFSKPRPIYNLQEVTEQPGKTVVIVEGEKAADAGKKLIPTSVVSSWIGGAKAIKETDWSSLYGRNIILWPDNDKEQKYGDTHEKAGQVKPWAEQPGNAAMLEIEAILKPHCKIIKWVKNADEFPNKWDIADATWTPDQATAYVRANLYEPNLKGVQSANTAPEKKAPAIVPNQKPEPAPVDPEPPKFDDYQDEDIPFKFLGFDKSESGGQRFHFYVKHSSTVFSYSASSLSKVNLMTLAPLNWWESRFMNKSGLNLDMAQSWAINSGSLVGPFDESRIRGRGAWVEGKNVVLHGGNKLIINGKIASLKETNGSRYIYEAGRELGFNVDNPLPSKDAHRLMDVIGLLNWERPINQYLFAGWCILAPVCGALKWRPHVWITGAAGTGKSWIMKYIMRRILGHSATAVQSETTEAGIRQMLGHDALPIVFDEAEGSDRRDSDRIQTILNLMRAASAEDGGLMVKGSAGGHSKTYRIRSCFAFASISVGVYLQSDRSRVSVLGLVTEQDREKKDEKWNKLKVLHREIITEDYCNKLRARTVKILPTIIKNAETFSDAVAFELGEQRAGDQLGTLLAGAYSLHSDKVISYEDACAWVKAKDWSEERVSEGAKDEVALFGYLMEQITRIETAIGTIERNVGELVRVAAGLELNTNVLDPENCQNRLKRTGFKVEEGFIFISNTSDWVKKTLANTQWSKNHNKILQRIQGAEAVNSVRFGSGVPTRAVKIPLAMVVIPIK